jgi:hypothetical protein
MTRVAWQLKKETLVKEIPGITKKKFLFNLSRSSYEKEWGTEYHRPGLRTRLVSSMLRLVPKSGPFKSLAFRAPTPEVEKMFMASFNATVDTYRTLLAAVDGGQLDLPNENFDLGTPALAGHYRGADLAYDKLLAKLADRKFEGLTPDLRQNILAYYAAMNPAIPLKATKEQTAALASTRNQLDSLRALPETSPALLAP